SPRSSRHHLHGGARDHGTGARLDLVPALAASARGSQGPCGARERARRARAALPGHRIAPPHPPGLFGGGAPLPPPPPPLPPLSRPAHPLSRQALAEDGVAGRKGRKGSTVFIVPWLLHRHRLLWERPDTFEPERFAPERAAQRHRFAYIPFGGGPRICIGAAF